MTLSHAAGPTDVPLMDGTIGGMIAGALKSKDFGGGVGEILVLYPTVSGKGIPAALLMANLQATLRTHCERNFDSLAARAQAVNRYFYESTSPEHLALRAIATRN